MISTLEVPLKAEHVLGNSHIEDVIRFVLNHPHFSPCAKAVVVSRLKAPQTADEMKAARLVVDAFESIARNP